MNKVFIFGIGLATGSIASYLFCKKHYTTEMNNEIAKVVDYYKDKKSENDLVSDKIMESEEPEKDKNEDVTGPSMVEYHNISKTYDTMSDPDSISDDDCTVKIDNSEEICSTAPYIITSDEYGENGYELESWTLYSDGVLTDDTDQIIDDPNYYVGDILADANNFEDGSIFIRNTSEKKDYEILIVTDRYDEQHGGIYE